MPFKHSQERGFALVIGLVLLIALTLLALVAMRSTGLELAMVNSVTQQERAFVHADSARGIAREMYIYWGGSRIETGRNVAMPDFAATGVDCPGLGSSSSVIDPTTAGEGLDAPSVSVLSRRIQTVAASPPHILPAQTHNFPKDQADRCSFGYGVRQLDLGRSIITGSDAVNNPETMRHVAHHGYTFNAQGNESVAVAMAVYKINTSGNSRNP
jgi:hypothetical protein